MAKKKIKGIVIAVVLTAGICTGGVFGVRYVLQNRSTAVEVTSVANQNVAEWIAFGNDEGSQGTVVSDVSQNVQIPDDKVIKEVYVSEGDAVKIGDKLISYDTTLLELDKELQELTVQEIQLEIKSAEADLKKLQNTTPVAKKESDDDDSGSVLDNLEFPDFSGDDEGEDEARAARSSDEVLMASAQTDETQQTEASQPRESMPDQETQQEQSQNGNMEDGTVSGSETETSGEGEDEEEFVVGEDGAQVLTPDDLGEQDASGGILNKEDDGQQNQSEKEEKQAKMNLSMKPLLSNIRIKTAVELGDVLLADISDGQHSVQLADMKAGKIRLIPHFREKAGSHFEKQNTYMMLIGGLQVEREVTGKVYGTAQINGEDYPEIGGYMLVQEPTGENQNVARLTVAFHDGLEEEHEKSAELEDAYLEIETDVKNVDIGRLVFRLTGSADDDVVIVTGESQTEPETAQPETQDPETAETETADSENPDTEETPESDEVAQQSYDEAAEAESETEEASTETEEASTETEAVHDIQKVKVNVTWNDGTNGIYPKELILNIYDDEISTSEPVKTIKLTGTTEPEADARPDDPVETDAPERETEEETESEQESETENQDSKGGTTEQYENPLPGIRNWEITQEWETSLEKLNSYRVEVRADGQIPMVFYYLQNPSDEQIKWKSEEGTAVLNLTMTYQEPWESPVLKLNPLSELTYENGEKTLQNLSGGAYKGSGTKDDPFVFFVTDGVVIKSSFVNWVLGFNAEGTERRKDKNGDPVTGYYVRLEIRESDTITGAFIRSIDLDGTILTEYGYGPGTYWIFSSDTGITRYEEEVDEDPGELGGADPGWGSDTDGESYTAEELAEAIKEKEREIRKLKLDERSGQLKLKKYVKDLEESTVVSAVNGYVKSVGGDESAGEPYMVVSSEGGLYLKTTVSELDLDTVKKGDIVKATSWETNSSFQASITEINYFPSSTTSDSFYGTGNSNASSYPVLAHIEDTSGLTANEWVSVKFAAVSSDIDIYLPKAYIRSENGQSYVYKRDNEGRLKKQYVHTAGIISGYVGIKEGLSEDDYIAFPYGKNVKEGAKTTEESDEFF